MVNVREFIEKHKLQIAVTSIFLAVWLGFYILNPSAFSNSFTYTAILSVAPFTIIPALGLTYVIITGEIDLSFSSLMAVGALVFAYTWKNMGSTLIGLLFALLAGLVAGLLNGFLVAKLEIPSMIATVGTMFFWRGIVLVATEGYGVSLRETEGTLLRSILVGRLGGIPMQFIWAIIVAASLWLILNRHRFGAYVYYTGDNKLAAKMVGINTERTLLYVFALNGMIAAFTGVLVALELRTVWPALGDIYMLKSVAAVVIGGTPLTGGMGTIFGTFMGGLILEFIETGVLAAGVSGFWIKVVHGVVIVIALVVQAIIRKGELVKIRRIKESLTRK